MKLEKIQDIVELKLSENEVLRDNDNMLYVGVLEYIKPEVTKRPFWAVMMDEPSLPCFESVRRARQKLQAAKPWLRGEEAVRRFRADNEEIYREYARKEIR